MTPGIEAIRVGATFLAGMLLLTTSACGGPAPGAGDNVVTATVDRAAPATGPGSLVPTPRSLSWSPPASRTTSPTIPRRVGIRAVIDVPGPDDGPACSVARQYSDEPPTGLRADAKAAWISVKKRAAVQGVTLCLNDGKRSRTQQTGLLDSYVAQYGAATAHELVLPWQKSAHVQGDAVDVQPARAHQWLQATKGASGFCRSYDNEAWHFEYSPSYRKSGCPARTPEPTG